MVSRAESHARQHDHLRNPFGRGVVVRGSDADAPLHLDRGESGLPRRVPVALLGENETTLPRPVTVEQRFDRRPTCRQAPGGNISRQRRGFLHETLERVLGQFSDEDVRQFRVGGENLEFGVLHMM